MLQKITPSSKSISLNVVVTLTLSYTASTATPANFAVSSNGIPSLAKSAKISGSTSSKLFSNF